jgi:hypothetical protein
MTYVAPGVAYPKMPIEIIRPQLIPHPMTAKCGTEADSTMEGMKADDEEKNAVTPPLAFFQGRTKRKRQENPSIWHAHH